MNQKSWQTVVTNLFNELKEGEALALSLKAEDTLFVRMTQALVRQSTDVAQGFAELSYFKNNRNIRITVPIAFQPEKDLKVCVGALQRCRAEISHLPEDPFLQMPADHGHFYQEASQKVERHQLVERCLSQVQGTDFVGILTAGEIIRANQNSKGLDQWFESSTFCVDFSFYTKNQQAVKGLYGGRSWQDQEYRDLITKKLGLLDHLNHSLMTLEKKKYRAFFSPSAVATLMGALAWTGFASREAYESGQSALKKLIDGEAKLSPMLTLQENFSFGEMPRFNDLGEVCDEIVSLVEKGGFRNLLCSSRSAKEFGVPSNFANAQESFRSPEILPGHLPSDQEMEALGTGIYISDLHYLNWSNVQQGSITGMTRFGCFWVENGKIVAPVKDMRFDESLYHFWGDGLEGFTNKGETFPKTGSYYQRELGVIKAPGMLVNDFTFVL
jgi:predicted Zn-dependent protease